MKRSRIGLFSVINRYDLGYTILNHYSNDIIFYSKISSYLKILEKEEKVITRGTLLSLIVNRSTMKNRYSKFLVFFNFRRDLLFKWLE